MRHFPRTPFSDYFMTDRYTEIPLTNPDKIIAASTWRVLVKIEARWATRIGGMRWHLCRRPGELG